MGNCQSSVLLLICLQLHGSGNSPCSGHLAILDHADPLCTPGREEGGGLSLPGFTVSSKSLGETSKDAAASSTLAGMLSESAQPGPAVATAPGPDPILGPRAQTLPDLRASASPSPIGPDFSQ